VTYFTKRLAQADYAAFQAAGYPIGSGSTESANKLVVEARLKGSGMHWARAHVDWWHCAPWRAPTAGQRHGRAFAHDFEPRLSSGVAPAGKPVIRRLRQHWPKSPYRWPRSPPPKPAQRPLPRRIAGNQSSNGRPTALHPWKRYG
jgi:hypothetical protein